MKIKEWWFIDPLNETEKKLERQHGITDVQVKFYNGRLYQKEVDSPTEHNEWIPIQKLKNIKNEKN